ncbi:MAG: hypothetical protein QXI32_02095 [Candidatus Bathyarchaeia archaeon]
MVDIADFRVVIVESNLPELNIEAETYGSASNELRKLGFEILYESCTNILTPFQSQLFRRIVAKAPKSIAPLLDPIILGFAIHDASDLSNTDYVWLDLEGDEDIANSAWVRKNGQEEVIKIAFRLLERNLEKYILDAYDRRTRDDLVSVWEAQLNIDGCPVCGVKSLKREPLELNHKRLRGWLCTNCGHRVMVQNDVLRYLLERD